MELIRSIELTGKPLGSFQFLAGNRFFSHITFLGCAPNIALQPEQGPHYIRISIPPLEKPVLLSGARAPAPLCTDCKQPLENWKSRIESAEGEVIHCHQCHASIPVADLNFRKCACFSRNIIRVEPVFESGAIPANGFLDTLSTTFNTSFKYAYIGSK
jgi:hypothetical protein